MSSKNTLSPMMTHYMELKEKYGDAILLYRLGDFYEMFFEDAKKASKILDLTLTGRECGLTERAPMCGVPYHAVGGYISRLIESGNKVAICEQLSEPGDQKGMVKRDVIRVITPGTVIEDDILESGANNFLVSVFHHGTDFSVAWVDINTNEIKLKEFPGNTSVFDIEDFLLSLSPKEIIGNDEAVKASQVFLAVKAGRLPKIAAFYDYSFDFTCAKDALLKQLSAYDLSAYGLENKRAAVCAAGGLIEYINTTQKRALTHINAVSLVRSNSYMFLDFNTKRNLEMFETLAEKKRYGSLLWVIDKTKTGMGARLLREWLNFPLQSAQEIEKRQLSVAELVKNKSKRELFAATLSNIRDIERIITKISYGNVMPKDCIALRESLEQIPNLKKILEKCSSSHLTNIFEGLDELTDLRFRLKAALVDNPPNALKDGGFIRDGYSPELDVQRKFQHSGKAMLSDFEQQQKELTGVPALKVSYNRIFGYYIEIPRNKAAEAKIPFDYVRKQTVASGERYTTEALEKLQNDILSAGENCLKIEGELYLALKEYMTDFIVRLQQNSHLISVLDCLYSLAEVAVSYNYTRPKVSESVKHIKIVEGRHPVVERLLKANEYIPNDTTLDNKENLMMIITGPNMAGKSTYIRQIALITLLAHIGSFVPARQAEISVVDRIFTRVGASDNLVHGQSTFMVEMLEVANIINNATSRSLLILDEIGRGTSTLDGLSIAWAIVEYILTTIRAKSLFATHYHELTELEGLLDGVKNYRVLIQERDGTILFLHKIARGGANKSYGIEVASLAGIKQEITDRAKAILETLLSTHELSGNIENRLTDSVKSTTSVVGTQMSLFDDDPVAAEIKSILADINIDTCSPIEALTILNDMKKLLKKTK